MTGTLNARDNNGPQCVVYRKTSHAKSKDDGQGWGETEVNDTLNVFDSGETRTPTIVLENHPADSRVKISKDGIVQTLSSRMGTGGAIHLWLWKAKNLCCLKVHILMLQ